MKTTRIHDGNEYQANGVAMRLESTVSTMIETRITNNICVEIKEYLSDVEAKYIKNNNRKVEIPEILAQNIFSKLDQQMKKEISFFNSIKRTFKKTEHSEIEQIENDIDAEITAYEFIKWSYEDKLEDDEILEKIQNIKCIPEHMLD